MRRTWGRFCPVCSARRTVAEPNLCLELARIGDQELLHVPAGWGSVTFTHLPSRTVFVDNDRYLGEEWLGHWMAHELGHLALNSPKEEDAERVAKKLRPALQGRIKKS